MARLFNFLDMERIREESLALVEASRHLQIECVRLRIESQEIKSWKHQLCTETEEEALSIER